MGFCAVALPLFLFYEGIAKTALPTFGAMSFQVSRMFNRSGKQLRITGWRISRVAMCLHSGNVKTLAAIRLIRLLAEVPKAR